MVASPVGSLPRSMLVAVAVIAAAGVLGHGRARSDRPAWATGGAPGVHATGLRARLGKGHPRRSEPAGEDLRRFEPLIGGQGEPPTFAWVRRERAML